MVSLRHFVIAVVGPTATGKSALAESLAHRLDGEIVSADSMQVYKGMDIGTAKVPADRRSIPLHCVDLIHPNERFSASAYQKAARKAFDAIWARGKQPILCGGTGLYVRAALEDFVAQEQDNDQELAYIRFKRRERLSKEADTLGPETFHAKLAALDAQSAALIHPNNVRRVIRAFEWLEEGSSYAEHARGFTEHDELYPTVVLGLDMPRDQLYVRINTRVRQMVAQGLLNEVHDLLDKGYGEALTAQQAIGYKELLGVVSGHDDMESAVAQIQQATRRYAKRQLSWFRRDKRIHWLDARLSLKKLTEQACSIIAHEMDAHEKSDLEAGV